MLLGYMIKVDRWIDNRVLALSSTTFIPSLGIRSPPHSVHLSVILHHAPLPPALLLVHLVPVHAEGVEILVDAAAVLAPPLRRSAMPGLDVHPHLFRQGTRFSTLSMYVSVFSIEAP